MNSTEDPNYQAVREIALKNGASGDYYYKPTDTYYSVAVNKRRGVAIILGWYRGEIKRQSPDAALQISTDLWDPFVGKLSS